jgi:hypothetical protein
MFGGRISDPVRFIKTVLRRLVKVSPENRPALNTGSLRPDFAFALRLLANRGFSEKKIQASSWNI